MDPKVAEERGTLIIGGFEATPDSGLARLVLDLRMGNASHGIMT
jgi:hypothetical protein